MLECSVRVSLKLFVITGVKDKKGEKKRKKKPLELGVTENVAGPRYTRTAHSLF